MKTLKEKLNAKLSKNGGFTLVEMLIVVAIIAILVAVSIPMIGTSLETAKEATDSANLRSAKAAAVIEVVGNGRTDLADKWYDNVSGTFKDDPPAAYSQKTSGQAVKVTKATTTEIEVKWATVA